MSQKFPNFNAENVDGDGDKGIGDGMEDQSNDKKDDGKEKDKGKRKEYDGKKGKDNGKNRNRDDRSDGSWTFPYYSCNHQAWLASLVIPIRADNRSLIIIITIVIITSLSSESPIPTDM